MNNAISFSSIDTFRRCPKRYEYREVRQLQRKKRATQLYQGILVHEALMTYYLALRDGMVDGRAAVYAFFADAYLQARQNPTLFADELADEIKIIEDSEDLVYRYLAKWNDSWTVLHVEEEFYVTLDSGDVISFTPDLVVEDESGFVWIVDHKTTASLPTNDQTHADLQSTLYYAGVQALYPNLQGFIFNKLRKKRPTQPKLTKTGKLRISDLDRIDTSFEVLRDYIVQHAPQLLEDDRHMRRLAKLRDEERFFWREVIVITEPMTRAALDDAYITLKYMDVSAETGYPRTFQEDRGWKSCSRCPFHRLCQAELLEWDAETVLAEDYEPRDPKNPYESED